MAPYINNAFVEKNSAATVFQFIGTGIKDISITDAAGKSVSVDSNTRFQNGNFKSINIGKLAKVFF